MDFATMKVKVETGVYGHQMHRAVAAFRKDFELICSNAMAFHRPNERCHVMAKRILKLGTDMLHTTFPHACHLVALVPPSMELAAWCFLCCRALALRFEPCWWAHQVEHEKDGSLPEIKGEKPKGDKSNQENEQKQQPPQQQRADEEVRRHMGFAHPWGLARANEACLQEGM